MAPSVHTALYLYVAYTYDDRQAIGHALGPNKCTRKVHTHTPCVPIVSFSLNQKHPCNGHHDDDDDAPQQLPKSN